MNTQRTPILLCDYWAGGLANPKVVNLRRYSGPGVVQQGGLWLGDVWYVMAALRPLYPQGSTSNRGPATLMACVREGGFILPCREPGLVLVDHLDYKDATDAVLEKSPEGPGFDPAKNTWTVRNPDTGEVKVFVPHTDYLHRGNHAWFPTVDSFVKPLWIGVWPGGRVETLARWSVPELFGLLVDEWESKTGGDWVADNKRKAWSYVIDKVFGFLFDALAVVGTVVPAVAPVTTAVSKVGNKVTDVVASALLPQSSKDAANIIPPPNTSVPDEAQRFILELATLAWKAGNGDPVKGAPIAVEALRTVGGDDLADLAAAVFSKAGVL